MLSAATERLTSAGLAKIAAIDLNSHTLDSAVEMVMLTFPDTPTRRRQPTRSGYRPWGQAGFTHSSMDCRYTLRLSVDAEPTDSQDLYPTHAPSRLAGLISRWRGTTRRGHAQA